MDFELWLFLVGFPLIYVAGILTHKYAIDQAEKIKQHATAEVQEVRADIAALRSDLASLLSKAAAKV